MATRNALETALVDAPFDDTGYLVYADYLQAQSDPRGDLIAIEDAVRRASPEERTAWRLRRDALIAGHPELEPPTPQHVELGWHLGFVRELRIHDTSAIAALGPVFAHPALAFVTSVVLDAWRFVDAAEVAQVLAYAPSTLRALALGDPDRPRQMTGLPFDLTATLAALPKLERLFVSRAARFEHAPALRSLQLVDGSAETLAWLAAITLPSLSSLALDLGAGRSLFAMVEPTSTEPRSTDLSALFAAPWPALTALALDDVPFGDEVIAALIASPLLRRLRTLRLWNAGLTPAGARAITRTHFGHLELLDLSDAGLDDESARLVAGACRDVRTVPTAARLD